MTLDVRFLYAACDRVPGPSAAGTRTAQLIQSISPQLEADGLSIKSEELAHIQRLGTARMMRVPGVEGNVIERISAFQRALKRQLEGDNYDLCHASDAWAGAVVAQHKEQADICLVTELAELPSATLTERFPTPPIDEKVRAVIRRGEGLVIQRSNALVVESSAAARLVVAAGAAPEKVHVIPPGIDDTVFFASSIELRLHEGRFNILYAGAPDTSRGLGILLQALKLLPPAVMVTLVRQRASEPHVEETVKAAGLADRVAWADGSTQAKLAQAFQSADAVVLLPSGETGTLHGAHLPRRLLEAMMCRRAVVAADTPGVRELIKDGQSGMLVPQRDVRALKDALHTLHVDGVVRGRLAQKAAETAAPFTWAARLKEYRRLYTAMTQVDFEPADEKKGRAGGLAERLKAQRSAAATAPPPVPPAAAATTSPAPLRPAPAPIPAAVPPPAREARPRAPAPVPAAEGPRPAPVPTPELPPAASLPQAWPFGNPTTADGGRAARLGPDGRPGTDRPPGQVPAFLTEPTPSASSVGLAVIPADEEAPPPPPDLPRMTDMALAQDAADPWGGDTVAVAAPPDQMEMRTDSSPQRTIDSTPPVSLDSNPPASTDSNPPTLMESNPPIFTESNPAVTVETLALGHTDRQAAIPTLTSFPALDSTPPLLPNVPVTDPFGGNTEVHAVGDLRPAGPAAISRGPAGMRSLALLDEVEAQAPPPRPMGGEETERVDLSTAQLGILRGAAPVTNAAAKSARFTEPLAEQPTLNNLRPEDAATSPGTEPPTPPPATKTTPAPGRPRDEPTPSS